MNAGDILRQFWWRTVSHMSSRGRSKASKRGLDLLKVNLTPDQLYDFLTYRRFDVVGGNTGRKYQIRTGGVMNVKELRPDGSCLRRLCFFPEGELVDGDVLLAQKVALEAFEAETLAVANKLPSVGEQP